jgi:peptidoglycan DL-endopeptidase CwlO
MGGLTRRLAALGAMLSLAALAATAANAEPVSTPEIEAERERAQAVLAEIAAIDAELERAVDAYNGATYELGQIEAEIEENQRHLKIAKRAYRIAQKNLEERIVTLYENGEQDVLEVILGATSLDDLLDRIDSVKRISSQDVEIIRGVTRAKADIRERERKLERARKRQRDVVADRAAARESIESQLSEREDLYASIKDQIVELEAAERERQRRAAEEARRREAEQRALAEAAAAAGVDQSVVAEIATVSPEGIGTAPPSQQGAAAVAVAMQYLGVPYVWGGMSPAGFDCSGLVAYSYAQIGIYLPHHAASMFGLGVSVSWGELAPGDLVFANGLGHMGMYIGGGQYIHSPHTGDVVRIASMSSRSDWVGFRRVA